MGRKLLRVVVPLVFWLGVWQLAAIFVGEELLLPGPGAVLRTLGALGVTAEFWRITGISLWRIFAGFLAGAALGAAVAVLTAAFSWADWLLSPAVRVIRAVPVASFIILVLLWVTTGRVPGVCAGLMVLPVVWENTAKGIAQTDPLLLEAARAYRFGRWKTARLVYFPSTLPYLVSGCCTGLGLAWKAGVAAEVLCLPTWAIGTEIFNGRRYLETPALFAWTIVVILLSFVLENAFTRLARGLERGRRA